MADPFARRSGGCRGRFVQWEGHQLVEIENAQLLVRVSMSRGAEILELLDKRTDIDVLWHGHPDIVRNRGGTPSIGLPRGNFHDQFSGGWQEVLPSAQFPSDQHGAAEGVHGEVALLPWEWRLAVDTPDRVVVEATVRTRRYPLTLTRTMTIERDRATLEVNERLVNDSDIELSVAWGHHICLSGELAAPNARWDMPDATRLMVPDSMTRWSVLRPGETVWPRVGSTDGGELDLRVLPQSNATDGVVIAGPMSNGHASIDNPALDLRVDLDWDPEVFPYCWSWMVWQGHRGWPLWGRERLLTIEPFTTPLIPLAEAATEGSTMKLKGYAEVETELCMTLSPSTLLSAAE